MTSLPSRGRLDGFHLSNRSSHPVAFAYEETSVQFMVLSRRHTDRFAESDFDEVIPAETERVRALYADSVIRQIWLRADLPGACFLVEADDVVAAQTLVQSLPMAAAGLSEFTVIPLTPYRGFGPR